jgi:hypothetical protein
MTRVARSIRGEAPMTPMRVGFTRGVRSGVTGHEYAEKLPAVNERGISE